jgi:hypothetical protein
MSNKCYIIWESPKDNNNIYDLKSQELATQLHNNLKSRNYFNKVFLYNKIKHNIEDNDDNFVICVNTFKDKEYVWGTKENPKIVILNNKENTSIHHLTDLNEYIPENVIIDDHDSCITKKSKVLQLYVNDEKIKNETILFYNWIYDVINKTIQ